MHVYVFVTLLVIWFTRKHGLSLETSLIRYSPWRYGRSCLRDAASNENFADIPTDTNILTSSNNGDDITLKSQSSLTPSTNINQEHRLRFGGVGRLYAADADAEVDTVLARLSAATVAVIGVGGVGSWAAEALCRSGIGSLILVDLDDICISNTNRQLHAMSSTIGQMKTDVVQQRLQDIAPQCDITVIHDFVSTDNVHSILTDLLERHGLNVVLDAIDGSKEKSALLAACADCQIPVVTCGGAAGRTDPTQIVCQDLVLVQGDPLLSTVRKNLRKRYGFPAGVSFHDRQLSKSGKTRIQKWNIECVYSTEPQKQLSPSVENDTSSLRRCDGALGTACFVTGTAGFMAAGLVIDQIASGKTLDPPRR